MLMTYNNNMNAEGSRQHPFSKSKILCRNVPPSVVITIMNVMIELAEYRYKYVTSGIKPKAVLTEYMKMTNAGCKAGIYNQETGLCTNKRNVTSELKPDVTKGSVLQY
jgi:hypothetical protein